MTCYREENWEIGGSDRGGAGLTQPGRSPIRGCGLLTTHFLASSGRNVEDVHAPQGLVGVFVVPHTGDAARPVMALTFHAHPSGTPQGVTQGDGL